jgi:hypothetical protein
MARPPLVRFTRDPARLAVIAECMEHYGVGDPNAEWPNNLLSREAIVYGSGRIARQGEAVHHNVDPDELDLARALATSAAALLSTIEVGMGSEGGPDPWHPFFIVPNVGAAGEKITEAVIRSRFAGTIFPPATVRVEPVSEDTQFWAEFAGYHSESDPVTRDRILDTMRRAMRWFVDEEALMDRAFVMIGEAERLWEIPNTDYPPGTENTGCVLPRLILGMTRAGSLAGVFGHTVQT